MTTHLCPVCAMPKPDGLKHCSLKCEEADPLPQPESWTCPHGVEDGYGCVQCETPAPVEGASE